MHSSSTLSWALAVVCLLGSARSPAAPSQPDLQALLARTIIGPDLPLAEVQAYTESRVPLLPAVRTARQWQKIAERTRRDVLRNVVFRGEAARWRAAETKVVWLETIAGGPGYRIRKLRYEALPGLWIPALLYEPDQLSGKVPASLNVNGHDANGKAAPYKQMRCINQAKRGMLALNVEWFGMGQLRGQMSEHYRMNQLDLCGTSGLAPFYLAMKRGLDVLLSLNHADPKRVVVSGLSGGGWQTIVISSLDTRVTLANPVAGYSSFRTRARFLEDLGDSEQTPCDLATVADYAHLTALRAPRPTLLTYNAKDDCCFASGHALEPLLQAAQPVFRLFGKEGNLRSHVNHDPGTHNFERDNREAFYRMLGDHFFANDRGFNSQEIPSDAELKTSEQLLVELPPDSASFNSLARDLSRGLPREPAVPSDPGALKKWQQRRRQMLREIVRARNYEVRAERAGVEQQGDVRAAFWKLNLGTDWTVPAVELARGEQKATVILVADGGRTNASAHAERLLGLGNRVLAVDPFYFGESKIKSRDHLFGLLVAAVGDRPLGLQASQLAAIARWARSAFDTGPVTLVAVGPRAATFSLVAAGLEEQAIAGLEVHGALGSLKEIIEKNRGVNQWPELFCFGLLEWFDIEQLAALVSPRPIAWVRRAQP